MEKIKLEKNNNRLFKFGISILVLTFKIKITSYFYHTLNMGKTKPLKA